MPFNGTGVFSRVYQWVQDAANGIFVDATRTDTDSNDIASGLTNCVTRDGQSPWLANLPAGGFKITGLSAGSQPADSVNYLQVFTNPTFNGTATFQSIIGTGTINFGSATSVTVPTVVVTDNSNNAASTAFVTQKAFQSALPAQQLGVVRYNGSTVDFSVTFDGFAVNEVKGANIASAATINLTTATGNLVHVTGTTNISAITIPSGAQRVVVFDGVLTLINSANLILPGNIDRVTAAGDSIVVRGDGSGVARVVSYQTFSGVALSPFPYIKVSDQKASGTAGGASVASDITQTRTFNTVDVNTITGASLATNTVTLPAGTYEVSGFSSFNNSLIAKIFLYNSSDSTYAIIGVNGGTGAAGNPSHVVLSGRFTITASKNFIMRYYVSNAQAANGLGLALSSGQVEIYSQIEFRKVA
jgi:hypothetical protein